MVCGSDPIVYARESQDGIYYTHKMKVVCMRRGGILFGLSLPARKCTLQYKGLMLSWFAKTKCT